MTEKEAFLAYMRDAKRVLDFSMPGENASIPWDVLKGLLDCAACLHKLFGRVLTDEASRQNKTLHAAE